MSEYIILKDDNITSIINIDYFADLDISDKDIKTMEEIKRKLKND